MARPKIYLNVALDAEIPESLETPFQNGDEEKLKEWALGELEKLLDGEESDVEFAAQLLSIQLKKK